LIGHDLFGKPLHSFPDHALALNHAIARAAERIILGRSRGHELEE
jgi:hypothetical protein